MEQPTASFAFTATRAVAIVLWPSVVRGACGALGVEEDAWQTRRRIWWITFSL